MAAAVAMLAGTLVSSHADALSLNVVYIVADDHTYRDFGFMGSKEALTPNLDRLASKSACFTNGYVPTSLCSPSLSVLLTGRYPHQSGICYNHPPPGNAAFNRMESREEYERARQPAFALIKAQFTLPRVLADLGYRSLQTGKFWEGHYSNGGFTDGMTLFTPVPGQLFGGNRTLKSGELAAHGNGDHGLKIGRETMKPIADFLDKCGSSQPFFIWYAPYLPHQPHDSPERFYRKHEGRGIPEHRIPYVASISQFDETVGQLVDMVEKRGLAERTLFVFLCDNGWTPSATRDRKSPGEFVHTRESKYSPFEDGIRTPILLRWDGHIPPGRHEQCVSSVDLMPTVLHAVGGPQIVPALPGRSLLDAAQGSTPLEQRAVFGEIYPGDSSSLGHPSVDIAYRWVRLGKYKLIVPQAGRKQVAKGSYVTRISLFDVVQDPGETRNLADDPAHAATVADLQKKLDAWWLPERDGDKKVPKLSP